MNESGVIEIDSSVPLIPDRTALVIVDLTRSYVGESTLIRALEQVDGLSATAFLERMSEQVVPTAQELREGFRERGLPVILTREGSVHEDMRDIPFISREFLAALEQQTGLPVKNVLWEGHPEAKYDERLEARDGEYSILKPGFSAFTSSKFTQLIADLGIESIVICGVTTSCCIESTTRGGADAGLGCVVVEPGVADLDGEAHDASLRAIDLNFGSVAPSVAALFEALDAGARV